MTPSDTRLTWQLCWALGVHGQAQALPCQVTMHRVYPTARGADTSSVDLGAGGSMGAGAYVGAAEGVCGGRLQFWE